MFGFFILFSCTEQDSAPPKVAPVTVDVSEEELKPVMALLQHPLSTGDEGLPLRWSLSPGCGLEYEYRATMSPVATIDREKQIDLDIKSRGGFRLHQPPKNDFQIQYHTMHTVQKRNGKVEKKSTAPDQFQPTLLECSKNCAGFFETDGPTSMWLNGDLFPGMGLFFPPYPRESKTGSKATWLFSTKGVHIKGTSTSPMPDDLKYENNGQVQLRKWFEMNGESVAWVTATWKHGSDSKPFVFEEMMGSIVYPIKALAHGDYKGQYLIDSNGRILWAKIEGASVAETGMLLNSGRTRATKQLSKILPEEFKLAHQITGELSLVSSCSKTDLKMNGFPPAD